MPRKSDTRRKVKVPKLALPPITHHGGVTTSGLNPTTAVTPKFKAYNL